MVSRPCVSCPCFQNTLLPIGSMYGIYTNIGGILMVNVTIYSIHGSYGLSSIIPLNRVFFESVGVFSVCTRFFVVSKRLYFMLKTMRLVHVGNLMKFNEIKKWSHVVSCSLWRLHMLWVPSGNQTWLAGISSTTLDYPRVFLGGFLIHAGSPKSSIYRWGFSWIVQFF